MSKNFFRPYSYEIKMKRMQEAGTTCEPGERVKEKAKKGSVLCRRQGKGPKSIMLTVLSDWSGEKMGFLHTRIFSIPFHIENELLLFRKLLPFIVVLIRD